jgi:hypothetical protein
MNENFLNLINFQNKNFDFKKFLINKDSIIIKNSSSLKIKIKSKINKIVIENCDKIKIKVGDTISGIEINNSNNINIKIRKNKKINLIQSYKSNIDVKLQEKQEKNIKFIIEESNVNLNIY